MPCNRDKDGNPKYQVYIYYMPDLLFGVDKCIVQYLGRKHDQDRHNESILQVK